VPRFVTALLACALACAHGGRPEDRPTAAGADGEPAAAYFQRLLAGDVAALRAAFAGEPAVDDPMGGRVRGEDALGAFVAERRRWLAERRARVESLRTTRGPARTIWEGMLHLRLPDRAIDLPVAVVGDRGGPGRVRALRVYHSLWPLEGHHRVRPPLLPADPAAAFTGAVAGYQRALEAGDVDGAVAAFEPDGSFREPSGEPYVHRGHAALHAFLHEILGAGGIGLEHATITDDGTACALEFNAVRFGRRTLPPQAGLAVYERGASGLIHAARIYDDVNVEALAGPAPAAPPP